MAHKTENHSNMALFKNRLWKLMEEKKLLTATELAKELHQNGLIHINSRSSDSYLDINKERKDVDSIRKKIDSHLNSDTPDKLQIEYLLAYCEYFNCSSDYLLGKIAFKTHDNKFICTETGLSERTIEVLKSYCEENTWLLDTINILCNSRDEEYSNTYIFKLIHDFLYAKVDHSQSDLVYSDGIGSKIHTPIVQSVLDAAIRDDLSKEMDAVRNWVKQREKNDVINSTN